MPESVTDRPTKAHEYIFMLSKREKYFFDQEAVKEQGTMHPVDWENGEPKRESFKRGGFNGKTEDTPGRNAFRAISATRNLRSVWSIATQPYPEAHFATFPEEIPKRCILAGTSARGCCPECGAPWKRVVETGYKQHRQAGPWCDRGQDERGMDRSAGMFKHGNATRVDVTTGWRPTCSCGLPDTVPAVVLDPFAGSGTTVAVAESLGRRGIGLELKWDYITLARKRMARVTPGLPLA